MSYLLIKNKGEMDILALTLMGATSKEGDSSKIGFFGSGNKYAITTLLREGHHLQIFSGLTEYKISVRDVSFRDTIYQQVVINGENTSLTTRMGPAWETWMAIREFYCNAVDEGLITFEVVSEVQEPLEDETAIYIEMSPKIQYFLDNVGDYICSDKVLDIVDTSYGSVAILDNQKGRRYRKGISCVSEDHKSLFSYNYEDIRINESRIAETSYEQYERIACALAATNNSDIIVRLIANIRNKELLESEAIWLENYCISHFSQTWETVLLGLNMPVIAESLARYFGEKGVVGCLIMPDSFVDKIRRDLPKVPVIGDINNESMDASPSEELIAEVEKCVTELTTWGFKDIVINYCIFSDPNTLGQWKNDKVYISVNCPLDQVIYTLHEELIHRDTGFIDYSRALQTWLFEKVVALEREIRR